MKKVYVARDPAEAHIVKGLVETHDIPCILKGEQLFAGRGGLPAGLDTQPSVWVVDNRDCKMAGQIAMEYDRALTSEIGDNDRQWRCPVCSEEIDAQFSECWQCGQEKVPTNAERK